MLITLLLLLLCAAGAKLYTLLLIWCLSRFPQQGHFWDKWNKEVDRNRKRGNRNGLLYLRVHIWMKYCATFGNFYVRNMIQKFQLLLQQLRRERISSSSSHPQRHRWGGRISLLWKTTFVFYSHACRMQWWQNLRNLTCETTRREDFALNMRSCYNIKINFQTFLIAYYLFALNLGNTGICIGNSYYCLEGSGNLCSSCAY